jgi:hypothetical protein
VYYQQVGARPVLRRPNCQQLVIFGTPLLCKCPDTIHIGVTIRSLTMHKNYTITKIFLALTVIISAYSEPAQAQLDPGTSGKTGGDLIAIKTDPVLREIEMLKFNANATFELLAALEKNGAKISYKVVELDGVTMLEVKLNGALVASFAVGCKNCEPIVFEY